VVVRAVPVDLLLVDLLPVRLLLERLRAARAVRVVEWVE
jgi:hypothetical protein